MAVVTLQQIARRLGEEVFGERNYHYVTPTSFTATTVVAANQDLQDTNLSPDFYEGWYILRRGAATAPDRIRRVRTNGGYTPSSGTLTHQGPAYADTTYAAGDEVELWNILNPEAEIRLIISRALGRCYYLDRLPLSAAAWADGDMETSGVTNWTASGAETLTKITTASKIGLGSQALRVVNNGVSSGYAYQRLRVRTGEAYRVNALCNSAIGTPQIIVRDVTGAATITTTTATASQIGIHLLIRTDTFAIPSASTQIEVRLMGVAGTTDDIAWSFCQVLHNGDYQMPLPASVEEGRWVVGLDDRPGGVFPVNNVGLWETMRPFEPMGWFKADDYQQDANLGYVTLPEPLSLSRRPFLVVNRPFVTYGNEPAATSTGDATSYGVTMEYIMAHTKVLLWEEMLSGSALGMDLAEMGLDDAALQRAQKDADRMDAIYRPGVYKTPQLPRPWSGNWSRL